MDPPSPDSRSCERNTSTGLTLAPAVRMCRICAAALVAIGFLALTAGPASSQTLENAPFSAQRLRADAPRLFPPEPKPRFPAHAKDDAVDPVVPLRPLLDHLPLQTIEELLRTEERLTTVSFDKYQIKPRVSFHEIGFVITRPLR